jgi:uncharacterized Zn-finger protein
MNSVTFDHPVCYFFLHIALSAASADCPFCRTRPFSLC